MDTILTAKERRTVNAAIDIIKGFLPVGSSIVLYVHNYHGTPRMDATYFTARKTQHSDVRGDTPADKVEAAFRYERAEQADEAGYRDRRIAQLKTELAQLTA